MGKKNLTLLAVLATLILVSVLLAITNSGRKNSISDTDRFSVQDTSSISKISIEGKNVHNTLTKEEQVWSVNNKFEADPYIMRVLLSVLQNVEINRGVAKSQNQEIVHNLKEDGFLVKIFNGDKLVKSYYSVGNANKTMSFFMDDADQKPFIVNLPGYDSYVSGIFEITESDWRNRLIFSSTWRTLQKLEMHYTKDPDWDFVITFDMNFLKIEGVEQPDTTKMMDYLDQFTYFQTDRFITDGEYPYYDSLAKTDPYARLNITDINEQMSGEMDFFPKKDNDRMMLAKKGDGQLLLFNYQRIRNIFKKKQDFE